MAIMTYGHLLMLVVSLIERLLSVNNIIMYIVHCTIWLCNVYVCTYIPSVYGMHTYGYCIYYDLIHILILN